MRALAAAMATVVIGGMLAAPAAASPGEPLGEAEILLPGPGAQSALPMLGMTPDGRHAVGFLAAGDGSAGLLAEISHGPYWQPPIAAPLRFPVDSHAAIASPALALNRYGYPLLAWEQRDANYLSAGVFISYFDALGRPVSERLRIDQQPPRQTHAIRAASNQHGTRHVVLWGADRGGSVDARARWYDNLLQPLGDEQRVDIGGLDVYPHIDVAMLAESPAHAVIAYIGLPATTPAFHDTLYLRRMSDIGELDAPVALAAGASSEGWIDHAEFPSLAATPDGGVLVVWRAVGRLPGTTQRRVQIRGQRLDGRLAPLSEAFALTPFFNHLDALREPDVAASPAGGFAVVWIERADAAAAPQVRLLHLDAAATPTGAAQTVAEGAQQLVLPQVAIDADGDTVVGWTALAADGSAQALRRRYRGNGSVDLALETSGSPQLAPGDAVPLTLAVHNLSMPAGEPGDFGRDYASGIVVQIEVAPTIDVAMLGGEGWTCSASAPLACRLQAIVPTGIAAPPLELQVSSAGPSGSYPLQIHIAGDQDDPQPHNNAAALAVHLLDQVPDAFAFLPVSGIARGSLAVSEATRVTGFDGSLLATVQGGELSVDGGAFSSAPLAVDAGASLRLRHAAADDFSSVRVTTLEIGGVTAEFRSETEAADTLPAAFAFAPANDVARSTPVESAAITVSGINAPAAISVVNGSYSVDGGAYTSAAGAVGPGQQVRVRHTSAAGFASRVTSTLVIGGVTADFVSTTEAADTAPAAFDFVDLVDARRRTTVTSNLVTVDGINTAAPISISGADASFAINGGAFSSAPRSVAAGDRVQIRLTTSNSAFVTSSATLSIGGVSDVWRVTTGRK